MYFMEMDFSIHHIKQNSFLLYQEIHKYTKDQNPESENQF